MKEIEEGEPFNLTTDKQVKAYKFLNEKVQDKPSKTRDIRDIVRMMRDEEIYDQKKDIRTFIDNCINSSNHPFKKSARFKIAVENKVEVKA